MPRPARSQDQIKDMRQRLADTALEIYKSEGYEAVSFRRLAASLDISHTLPYSYFENRDELFAAVRLDCYQRFLMAIRGGDPVEQGPVARLYALARVILNYAQKNPDEYRLMFAMHQPPLQRYPELLAIRQAAFDYLVAIVQQGVDAGLIKGEARTVMHMTWAAAHGLMTLHAAGQLVHGHTMDELVEP
ncbi:MAG: TetR/AcrR family transcriptional regulator, partial [Salinisphaeraceae bacterium]|nr:TetR/AcrR family transcriptional regulator [Salinisphaeraceae bacterium]